MSNKKLERTMPLSVEVAGEIHRAQVVIRGSRFHEFIIHYDGKTASDGRKWGLSSEEQRNMMAMAKATLIQMIASQP